MLFEVTFKNDKIKKAAEMAEKILKDPKFITLIGEQTFFSYTKELPSAIASKISYRALRKQPPVKINQYKTTWPWSSVVGYSARGQLYVNARKFEVLALLD